MTRKESKQGKLKSHVPSFACCWQQYGVPVTMAYFLSSVIKALSFKSFQKRALILLEPLRVIIVLNHFRDSKIAYNQNQEALLPLEISGMS